MKKQTISPIESYPWIIVQFMPKKSFELNEGNVIRFGWISFKVTRIRFTKNTTSYDEAGLDDGPGEI